MMKVSLHAPVVAKLQEGGAVATNDDSLYKHVCSDAYSPDEPREEQDTIHFTYPDRRRRRFRVTYKYDATGKHMVFRCEGGYRLAVFLDAMLGIDIQETVKDMFEKPARYVERSEDY